jgi:hypothetical protein
MTVTQDDRYCRVRPGDLVAYETSRPYQLIGTDVCDIVVIGIPRPMLGASVDLISRRTAVALPSDQGPRAVMAAFLSGLADNIDTLPGATGIRFADALVSLVISTFTETTLVRAGNVSELDRERHGVRRRRDGRLIVTGKLARWSKPPPIKRIPLTVTP